MQLIRNQLIKPNLRGKGVLSFYHMNFYLFTQQYAEFHEKNILFFDLSIQYKFNTQCRNIGQNQPLKVDLFNKILHTIV